MSNFVEEFIVGLGFEFSGDDGERFRKQTERISSTLNALSAAAAATLAALYAVAKTQGDQADATQKASTALDTSVEKLTRWQYAAKKVGSTGDALTGMMNGLKSASQEAARSGTGPFRAFEELDVDWQGIASGSVDVADAFGQIIAKAQTLDRATGQSALKELGIDPKFLDTPIAKLNEFMDDYGKFGGMTTELANKGGDFNDAFDKVGTRMEGIQNMLAERLLPSFTKFFEVLSNGLEWVQKEGFPILDAFVEKMGGWDKVLIALGVASIPALIGTLGTLLALVTSLTGAFGGAAGAAGKLMKLGAVGIAGAGGWALGTEIQKHLPDDVKDKIGEVVARSLAFLGVQEAKDAVATMDGITQDPNAPGDSYRDGLTGSEWDANRRQMERDYELARALHPEDYPAVSKGAAEYNSPLALRDAIIGRESGGNPNAVSNKGAQGLMQLMPATAQDTAKELGMPYDKDRLTKDPEYNKTLGTAYLQKMLDRYDNSEALAVAAYNAGPGSVDKWLKSNGDPRKGQVSVEDWIKSIPFKETREYTQNVLADKAKIVPQLQPPLAGPQSAPAPVSGPKTTTNHFHGMRQAEVEDLLRRAEEEERMNMDAEARDALVR